MQKSENLQRLFDKYSSDLPKIQKTIVKTLFVIMLCILQKEDVNMNKLKHNVGTILGKEGSKSSSRYQYLIRFFRNPICLQHVWKWLLLCISSELKVLISKMRGGKYLVLDGTSWELGDQKIHILTLSFVYRGVSIPIFFMNLEKKGCSTGRERMRLLELANKFFPLQDMTLLADREYVGLDWFIGLRERFSLNFVIRLSRTDYKTLLEKQGYKYSELLAKARKGKKVLVQLQVENHCFNLLFQRIDKPENSQDDLLILLYNQNISKKRVAQVYAIRWTIECMFKNLKSNGYKIENINFKCPKKIRLLIAIVAAIYFLCVQLGIKNIKGTYFRKNTKKYDISVFRIGIDALAQYAKNFQLFLKKIIQFSKYKHPQFKNV